VKTRIFNRSDAGVFHRWFHDARLKPFFRLQQAMGLNVQDCERMPEILKSIILVGEKDINNEVQNEFDINPVVACFTFAPLGSNNYRCGFMVDPDEQHKMYAWDIGRAGLEFAEKTLNAHRLDCIILETDVRLISGLEAAGFKIEGVMRDSIFFNGKYCNEVILSYLKQE